MDKKRVLVTGMSGLIGEAVRRHLGAKYELSALNRSSVPGVQCYQADIADLSAIHPAFDNKDVVVHLAAIVGEDPPWDDVLRSNVVGTYNVFEASRIAAVKRIIFASSGVVVAGYERDFPYSALIAGEHDALPSSWPVMTHESPVRPPSLYGVSKVWGEALGRYYSDIHDISVICLRIGQVRPEDRPLSARDFSVWCSQRDIVQMVERCIEAPESVRYDIFYGVSDNRWGYRDLDHARRVVGFDPQDSAEAHRR